MDRFKCPIAVFLILKKENKIYLQLRKNCSFEGMYGAVGGHVDGGETIINAVIREAKEEVGIDVSKSDLILKTICHSNAGGKEYIQFFFVCDKWLGMLENKEKDKCEQRHPSLDAIHHLITGISQINDGLNKLKHLDNLYEEGQGLITKRLLKYF